MCIWKCYVFAGKHGHKGRSHKKFKGAIEEPCSCLRAWWDHSQRWQGPKCYKGTYLRIGVKDRTSCEKILHLGREDDIVKMVQMEGGKCIMTRGPTCAKGRPNRAEMGLGRSAQAGRSSPFQGRFGPPFLEHEDVSTLSTWRHHSQGESHSPQRPSTS
jgi:hypothetical protein